MQLSRIGPFALEEALGDSRTSRVVRGVHVQQGVMAAVKLLSPELAAPALGERNLAADIKALCQLSHPCIAKVYGGGIDKERPYLALELVEGESLRARLDRIGRLPWETAVGIVQQICAALHHAHCKGVVHRRLTPARVMLTTDDRVKLIGFDVAWSDVDEVVGLRAPMDVSRYLAPETFRGKKSSRLPQVDLFSVGVILYECLT
ncbi:MAG: serine/threonine protein kinase, partial [Planctomycetales bacterium]|nr:serine/threonine protein kinase [Planctomycetales bacterium]